MVYWFWQSQNKKKWVMWTVLIAVVAMPFVPDQYIGRFKSIGGQEAEGQSKQKRIEILEDAWQVLKTHPLGVGVASFPAVRREMFGRKQDTHNLYLEVATNLGVQGFIVFIFLIGSMVVNVFRMKTCIRRIRSRTSEIYKSCNNSISKNSLKRLDSELQLIDATVTAIGGFMFVRLVLGLFGMDLYEVYWWFVAGLIISMNMMIINLSVVNKRKMESKR
jgi:hypothetical protein